MAWSWHVTDVTDQAVKARHKVKDLQKKWLYLAYKSKNH